MAERDNECSGVDCPECGCELPFTDEMDDGTPCFYDLDTAICDECGFEAQVSVGEDGDVWVRNG